MTGEESIRTLKLSDDLVSRVENRLPRTEWDNPEEYISHVLEEVLFHVEEEMEEDDFESVDETDVEERLKSLGYLNE